MGSRLLDLDSVPLKRKAGGNIWAKLIQITQILLIAAVLGGIFACFLPIIRQVQRLKEKKNANNAAIAAEQATNRQMSREFELLKSNPEYVERVSRDRLNVGKPGEMIFRFDPYADPNAANGTNGAGANGTPAAPNVAPGKTAPPASSASASSGR
ncbi:Septum formation initiator [Verrucomicrobium sp. GAS474]|uniref:FtsB family cell division protein n=1 Tax=Verrucomicrobium sp. GAS474 TaxID=1882831 RepID=UPI00087B5737|nr:septum formation initiator family protein [Verrucomicrobium sp. GAS474]SDU19515.1 Septum formation initiator [Verrucomicrobium sp. GAS474]